MLIGIDIDDTILEYSWWLEVHKQRNPRKFPQESPTFYDSMPANMSAVWAVKQLKNQGHKVIFITQPPRPENLANIPGKIKRMIQLFGKHTERDIYMAWDKSKVKCDVLIDNSPHLTDALLIHVNPKSDWIEVLKELKGLK